MNLLSITGNVVKFRDSVGDFKGLFIDQWCEISGYVICRRSDYL
jgi:hypothetical protein